MTTKDWKKKKSVSPNVYSWSKNNTIILVRKIGKWNIKTNKVTSGWEFSKYVNNIESNAEMKEFKTKQQALKYARDYMRKN